MADSVRIDKWLWAVRIFKTRSIAVEELKKHRILINGQPVKPSRMVSVGDEIDVRKPPIIRSYKVLGLLEKRIGAKLVLEYVADITPQEELDKFDTLSLNAAAIRARGTGRPTKKERRDLDDFNEV